MLADSKMIEWLLFESNISMPEIIKGSGISKRTAYDLKNKVSNIKNMSFRNADLLTCYAKKVYNQEEK